MNFLNLRTLQANKKKLEKTIQFSPIESSILGLKIGRCESPFFDPTDIYKQVVDGQYDLCRLKVPGEDEMVSSRLNKMGLPFFFSGSIQKYKTPIRESPTGHYKYPDLVFELYDGSQDDLLKEMLIDTWGTYPIGYYRTPYLETLVTKEKEIECVFQFYKKFNLNSAYPNNRIMFMKHGSEYVGFFGLNIVDNNLETHIGGILKRYRKSGYFLDQLRYIKEFCIRHGLEHFIFGARNENGEAQRVHQFAGFQPIGSDNVFHIPSLLTLSQSDPVIKEVPDDIPDSKMLFQYILKQSMLLSENILPSADGFSFHLNSFDDSLLGAAFKIKFSFPVLTHDELLIVVGCANQNVLPSTGYFRKFLK